jgi:hypothetical protein
MNRWLQLPLYLGLIVAQGVFIYHFRVELVHFVKPPAQDLHQRGRTWREVALPPGVHHIAFLLSVHAIAVADRVMPAPTMHDGRLRHIESLPRAST